MDVRIINYLEDLQPGRSASYQKCFTEADLAAFGAATDDLNPVHFDEAFARTTPFGGRVVHGMLTASLISTVLARHLPGPGCIYLSQSLRFCASVALGETVEATVTLLSVDREANRIRAETLCRVAEKIVISGECLFMAERSARPTPSFTHKRETQLP